MAKLLCSKKETAEALGVSLRTVDNLIDGKELAVRRVGRRVLIPVAEVERFTRRDHQTRPAAKLGMASADTTVLAGSGNTGTST
ncbi:MAG: helix-turn-helix domain-containing protein [Acidobacteria bacterium]|nr:helix-turn-helix domain-containing protein [Acidobacteriota bacterium]